MVWGPAGENCLLQVACHQSSNVVAPSLSSGLMASLTQMQTHARAPASTSLELVARFVLGDWGGGWAINKMEPLIIQTL